MAIPKEIRKEHIVEAIQYIDAHGVPEERASTKFNLVYNGNLYPPKYVISIANLYANGMELPPSEFSGGKESNDFLYSLGFLITGEHRYPFTSYSWTVFSDQEAIKRIDKSSYGGETGIPVDIRNFFRVLGMKHGEKKELFFKLGSQKFKARIEMYGGNSLRTKLIWGTDFTNILRQRFSQHYLLFSHQSANDMISQPEIRFRRVNQSDDTYIVILELPPELESLKADIDAELIEETGSRTEGTVSYYYGKRYERDPINRQLAIEIHGLSCKVCGFNFEEVYGERGAGYIEIHHIKPLSTFSGEEVDVNPETDLIPLCSNCHKMIHRRHDNVLTVEQLKEMVNKGDLL